MPRTTSLLAGAAGIALLGAAPASAAFPGTNGRIAFQGYQSLGTIDAGGGDRRPLTASPGAVSASPAWSADGRFVAYATNRDGGSFELRVKTWRVRAPKIPRIRSNCLLPGAKRPSRCPRR